LRGTFPLIAAAAAALGAIAVTSLSTWVGAVVAQDAHVFDGTIRDNVLLADPKAGEAKLSDALAVAAPAGTVAGFSAGLDTAGGPGGEALSGGQRRRLSVAQGVLRRPAVLLLESQPKASTARPPATCWSAFDPPFQRQRS
jgi:ABC-type multidrug transport system fused ATPase/permease subunit